MKIGIILTSAPTSNGKSGKYEDLLASFRAAVVKHNANLA
jgi:hypothetical protein